ncbi:MAG: CHAP domain-containing protein [Bacteroidetes bacterium HGW-Bacteroidetes-6]|nr:MAG: CHAP domain-containing protein [Bacteroidetes bacterium HGW-Bacteroidetes-6]
MKRRRYVILFFFVLLVGTFIVLKKNDVEPEKFIEKNLNINERKYTIGEPVDSFNGVYVYYNGKVSHVSGRNVAPDGYNLGQKYQCVEFVKRYYYEHLHHKMPDSYGHAKDFFDPKLKDGQKNKCRGLFQYTNPSKQKPRPDDLVVYSGTSLNKFGHVAIISKVSSNEIEIVQQNPGPYASSRATYPLKKANGKWKIENDRILGWLRK